PSSTLHHCSHDAVGTPSAVHSSPTRRASDPSPASFPGAESSGTTVALNAGSYSVSASSIAGYAQTGASSDCSGTIAAGETRTCTIVNDDVQPKLIVIQHVINEIGRAASGEGVSSSVTGRRR